MPVLVVPWIVVQELDSLKVIVAINCYLIGDCIFTKLYSLYCKCVINKELWNVKICLKLYAVTIVVVFQYS